MKKLTISVFLLLFQSVLMIDRQMNNTHANCYESYKIRVGNRNRPASKNVLPIGEEKDIFRDIPLARHHIIPYNVLRDFYNRLTANREYFQYFFDHVLVAAGTHAGVNLLTIPNIDRLRNVPLGELPASLREHFNRDRNQNYQENIAREVYTWLTFNIFIGPEPNSRHDDPGENFEDNAHVIVGQLRLEQLRRIQAEMIAYAQGRNTNPTNLLNEMGDLLRITPEPYAFNTFHWRYNRDLDRPYAIATADRAVNPNYRTLQDNDFCPIGEFPFVRYYPPDFGGRSRRFAKEEKTCLLRDEGAVYDRYCINSLNVLAKLIEENIVTLQDDEITFNGVAKADGTQPNCNPALAAAGGAVTGAGSAFAACLVMGGAYIPFVGWAGCAVGAGIYGAAGVVVGTSLSLAQCD